MALLMSFFVMLTAYSTTNKEKMNAVAGSMREAFGSQKVMRGGVVEIDGIPTKPYLKNVFVKPFDEASDITAPNSLKRKDEARSSPPSTAIRARQLLAAPGHAGSAGGAGSLQERDDRADARRAEHQSRRSGRALDVCRWRDPAGRAHPPHPGADRPDAAAHAEPHRDFGHTSATKPGSRPGWSAWELSAGRAAAVRELLANAGVPEDRFAAITGRSDTEPLFPDNPYLAANRRVTITLLFEAPPAPTG